MLRRILPFLTALYLILPLCGNDIGARERALQEKLVAACCWNESIAVHRSPTSLEMRAAVRRLIADGRTDRQILDAFKAKYGARVLIEPEGPQAAFAYATVVLVALAGLFTVILILRRWTKAPVMGESPSAT